MMMPRNLKISRKPRARPPRGKGHTLRSTFLPLATSDNHHSSLHDKQQKQDALSIPFVN